MIDLAILGLLENQPRHGYELKKELGELLGPWSSVSFGSLYPALARLERAGRVRAVPTEDDRRPAIPMTGALSGEVAAFRKRRTTTRGRRNKKVYAITDDGRAHLRELLLDPGPARRKLGDDRGFALRVALCRHLEPRQRLAMFEARRGRASSSTVGTRRRRQRRRRLPPIAPARRTRRPCNTTSNGSTSSSPPNATSSTTPTTPTPERADPTMCRGPGRTPVRGKEGPR
ncbi:MAG: PadR family transcriptional regulator [Acidimicrobiia bacterium]|nr:PadR family transcriptional regulator [Acidimicrobiia bacterium]